MRVWAVDPAARACYHAGACLRLLALGCAYLLLQKESNFVVFYDDFVKPERDREVVEPGQAQSNQSGCDWAWCGVRRFKHAADQELGRFRTYAELTARFAAFVRKAAESQVGGKL